MAQTSFLRSFSSTKPFIYIDFIDDKALPAPFTTPQYIQQHKMNGKR